MPGMIHQAADHKTLEDRIVQRLTAWQQKYPEGNGPRDMELEGDIYVFLYRALREIAHLLPGFDKRSVDPRADVSCRFTSMLNKAFERILEKYPDKLMRAKSRHQLQEYVSLTMSSMIMNHYKRENTYRRIIERLGWTESDDEQVRDILSHLADERSQYFEQRTGMPLQCALPLFEQWEQSEGAKDRDRARVLRLRYLDGLSYDDIAKAMKIDTEQVENLLEQAKYHLRKLRT